MKITIDIADALLERARLHAWQRGITLRALVEQGLRAALTQESREQAFKLRKTTFGGQGLSPEAASLDAAGLSELANDRGGG
ncbi:MAG: hypothetical protein ACKOD9_11365 [Rubrivivax sp.]